MILTVADIVDEDCDNDSRGDTNEEGEEENGDGDDVEGNRRIASRCSVARHGHPAAAPPHL